MSVKLSVCACCGHVYFPARHICHRCGDSAWTSMTVSHGILETSTTLLHQAGAEAPVNTYLGAVRTAAGPILLSRLDKLGAPNARVRLTQAPSGAVLGELET
jgi:uncharacterized OB-fold protein